MSPGTGCGPAQLDLDGTTSTTQTSTDQGSESSVDSTAQPRPVTLIGEQLLHDLSRAGYIVTRVCQGCGAPLRRPKSVAAGMGPVCAARLSE